MFNFALSEINLSTMKRIVLLLSFIFMFALLKAQDTYRFRTDAPQGISVTSSTASHLSLHYSIQELGIANVEYGEVKGQEIILKGQFAPNAEGRPNLPVVNRYVAIPQGATVSMQVRENASTTLTDIDLLPGTTAQTDLDEGMPQLRWDASIFGKDANFPTENFVLATPTQIRSLDVVMLSITPFRYNPVKRTLEVIYDLDINVRFEGGNGQFGESRYFNPDWKHILQNLVINGEMLSSADYYDLINTAGNRDVEGAEYLIITPNTTTALAWADTLKAFRTKQGIPTKVVTTTECGGNTDNAIRNYIVNAYNTWDIPPAAVLLFGGWYNNSGVRPFYHTTVQGDYNPQRYATDYPYCDMNGDSIADLALSRVTARTAQEYKTFVQKTIEYESNPYTDPAYYDRPIITAGHDANKWFLIHSQVLNGFYRDKLGKHPTNLYMVHTGSIPDTAWSTGFNTEVVVNYFGSNGQNYIPDDPSELHDWMSKSDSVPLINALNEGAFMTVYRGHSNFNAWWFPAFKYYTLDNVVNAPNTYVISVSCSCGIFTNAGRGMVEAFCLKEDGGGVGGIGANALTHSQFNDILGWGIYDCMWPDFLPDMGSSIAPEFIRPAFILAEAKNYLDFYYFLPNWWPGRGPSTKHIFGCTGETYLNLYTEVPQPLQVTHDLYMTASAHAFTVTADEGAVICLSQGDEIIGVFQSEGQSHTFTMPDMTVGGYFTVTATKQNHFRYEYDVYIIPDSGPYVAIERDGLLVENEFDALHNGENAHIGLKLRNYGNNTATTVSISLSCDSPYIEITQGTNQLQNITSNQTVTINNAFRFNIADDIPDMTEVTFTFHINDGGGVNVFNITQNVAAPLFVIKPNITYKNVSQQSILHLASNGDTEADGITDIHVQIANEGHFNSGPCILNFEAYAPFIAVESSSITFDALEKGCTDEAVFRVNSQPSEYIEAWVNAKIQLSDGIRTAYMDTLLPYGGFNETFDPGFFESHDWQMTGNAPWTITEEEFHTGSYGSRSGVITHNQSSTMSITQTTQTTEITFFKKLSTETNYDKLHFYIDDEELGLWSGNLPWKEERFPVAQGTHTFKWSYTKDYSVNLGQDCVWVDDIDILPAHTAIAYSGGTMTACTSGDVHINCNYAYDYRSLEWTTEGDGSFDNANNLHPTYTPGPNDVANGGVMLQLRADNVYSPLQLILTDDIDLGNEINGDDIISIDDVPISHYSIEGTDGLAYLWQLEPAEAGFIIEHGHAIDIVWDFRHNITEATLSVTSDASCIQETLSKTIEIDPVSLSEKRQPSFSLYPNPTDGKVNLIIGQNLQGKSVVEVYNVLGARMMDKTFQNLTTGQSIAFDLQHYTPGIYIIKLSNDEGCWSQKVSVR